jgi:hypothetical protein
MSDSQDASDPPNESAMRRFRAWIVLGVLYAFFFFWYTPLGGPLTEEEIAHYEKVLQELAPDDDESARRQSTFTRWKAFMRSDTGDDFAMFNAIHVRDKPEPVEGVEPGASSREIMNLYSKPFFERAVWNAAHPVMMGTAASEALDIWGIEDAEHWDMGLLVRYRSRRDIMNQVVALSELAASGNEIHRYKIAALEKTIAFPLDPWFQLGDPRLVLALVFAVIGLGLDVRRLSRA